MGCHLKLSLHCHYHPCSKHMFGPLYPPSSTPFLMLLKDSSIRQLIRCRMSPQSALLHPLLFISLGLAAPHPVKNARTRVTAIFVITFHSHYTLLLVLEPVLVNGCENFTSYKRRMKPRWNFTWTSATRVQRKHYRRHQSCPYIPECVFHTEKSLFVTQLIVF